MRALYRFPGLPLLMVWLAACAASTLFAANQPPQFMAGPDVDVNEDGGAQTFVGWATSIAPGSPSEVGQRVAFEVTNKDSTLFAVPPAIDSDGTLTFTPAHGAFGSGVVTVIAIDDGGIEDGGWDTSDEVEFVITILPVNDPPSFEVRSNPVITQDSGPVSLTNWAFRFNPGSQFEVGQVLEFEVVNDQSALFIQQPSVDTAGTLSFATAPGAHGVATLIIAARDNGGTERGGVDRSLPKTFTITILPLNRAPQAEIRVEPSSWLSRSLDDVVVIANARGIADVELDSSLSQDLDGDAIVRQWFASGEILIETNASIVLRFYPGEHDFALAVSDGAAETVTAVTVEVIDPEDAVAALADEVTERAGNRAIRNRLLAHLRQAERDFRRNRVPQAAWALILFEWEARRRMPRWSELVRHSREIRIAATGSRQR